MKEAAHRFLSNQPAWLIGAISMLGVAFIGTIDAASGYELSFSIFYAIPVAFCAWYAGRRTGMLVCLASAVAWLLADQVAGHVYSHPSMLFWNAGVRLGFFVIIAELLVRLHDALDFHESLSQRDGLTGILNARAFRLRCDSIFEIASRHGRSVALGYLDLDGFKAINDRLGHGTGDEVLKAVARALEVRLRASDSCGRMGGDEFAILLPETDLSRATVIFGFLRKRLLELAKSHGWPIGFSVGVAVCGGGRMNAIDALRFADELMYKAKASGKNRDVFEQYGENSDSVGLAE